MQTQAIYSKVQQDFSDVDNLIKSQLFSKVPLVEHIGHYIVTSGGKRLRPLLVLLASKAVTSSNLHQTDHRHCKLAAIIEFLHTATLLHDDVVDTSQLRRGRDTANAKWGNAPSVLVGDFLYSRAFQMMVDLGSMEVMTILADATNVIAEGEVLQLANCKNPDISFAQYLEVITAKTAKLFEAASHSAAVLCNATVNQQLALKQFGLDLGIAFQLMDDVLDYNGIAAEMGKNIGDDLAEGKPTLPLLYAQDHSSGKNRALIRRAIRQGGVEHLQEITEAVKTSGALAYTAGLAGEYANKAANHLSALPESDFKSALHDLTKAATNRNK